MQIRDGSRINFSRYYNSQNNPGLPPVAPPPLDAVIVEAKQHQRHGKAVVFPSNINDNTNCLGYSMLGCV